MLPCGVKVRDIRLFIYPGLCPGWVPGGPKGSNLAPGGTAPLKKILMD
jgi:hypothetical protein